MNKLEELATSTRDKPVAFLLQSVATELPRAEPGDPSAQPPTPQLERYVIRDGKISKLETVPSKGMVNDLQELLAITSTICPADKRGLILATHGYMTGFCGDTGSMDLTQFKASVQSALADGGKDKLDFMELNSCTMGQEQVLHASRDLSQDIVASPELIDSDLDWITPLQSLADNPQLDGNELARHMIAESRKQNEGLGGGLAFTIAHYKTEAYDDFRNALDNLGDQLCHMVSDPAQSRIVDCIVDNTHDYAASRLRNSPELRDVFYPGPLWMQGSRDLKDLCHRLTEAVDQGQLVDPAGSLRKSVEDLLSRQQNLVASYYGRGEDSADRGPGGYIPRTITDQAVSAHTSVGILSRLTDTSPGRFNPKWAGELRNEIQRSLNSANLSCEKVLDVEKHPQLKGDFQSMRAITKEIESARAPEQFRQALRELHERAHALKESPSFERVLKKTREFMEADRDAAHCQQAADELGGWGRFQQHLYGANRQEACRRTKERES
jgi:hypothetical protein